MSDEVVVFLAWFIQSMHPYFMLNILCKNICQKYIDLILIG